MLDALTLSQQPHATAICGNVALPTALPGRSHRPPLLNCLAVVRLCKFIWNSLPPPWASGRILRHTHIRVVHNGSVFLSLARAPVICLLQCPLTILRGRFLQLFPIFILLLARPTLSFCGAQVLAFSLTFLLGAPYRAVRSCPKRLHSLLWSGSWRRPLNLSPFLWSPTLWSANASLPAAV